MAEFGGGEANDLPSIQADMPGMPTFRSEPPLETRGQRTWGRAPACTVPHASRGLWRERDSKRVPQAGARLPGEGRERGTFLLSRHAGACTAVQKLSQPLEWLRSRPPRRVDKRGGGQCTMTCLVARHARHADLSEPPLVDVCRWDQASTPEGDGPPVRSRRWRRGGRSR